MNDIEYQSEILCNRLTKRFKHLSKWARRTGISSFRLYDKDIPEIPLAIDFYEGIVLDTQNKPVNKFKEKYLVIYLYERPYEKDESEEMNWLNQISIRASSALEIPVTNLFLKTRKKQKGENQYEKMSSQQLKTQLPLKLSIVEQGHQFIVNLSDYIDTGLFFDHRILRKIIENSCQNKDVLNLYCYTASFSVYAAKGGAKSVTSVDLSNTYLNWAKENFIINGFNIENEKFRFVASDVIKFLNADKNIYDLIILDPPTFSNSKKTQKDLDINRDWMNLVALCLERLSKEGTLYFSTNSKRIDFDEKLLDKNIVSREITEKTIPEDFKNRKIHKCWEIHKE